MRFSSVGPVARPGQRAIVHAFAVLSQPDTCRYLSHPQGTVRPASGRMLTALTTRRLSDAQLSLISGHKSQQSEGAQHGRDSLRLRQCYVMRDTHAAHSAQGVASEHYGDLVVKLLFVMALLPFGNIASTSIWHSVPGLRKVGGTCKPLIVAKRSTVISTPKSSCVTMTCSMP